MVVGSGLGVLSKLSFGAEALPEGTIAIQALEALPGKVPLIRKTIRPPNFETPISYFNEAFTPNNAFFIRYHLFDIPEVDAASWKDRWARSAAAGRVHT